MRSWALRDLGRWGSVLTEAFASVARRASAVGGASSRSATRRRVEASAFRARRVSAPGGVAWLSASRKASTGSNWSAARSDNTLGGVAASPARARARAVTPTARDGATGEDEAGAGDALWLWRARHCTTYWGSDISTARTAAGVRGFPATASRTVKSLSVDRRASVPGGVWTLLATRTRTSADESFASSANVAADTVGFVATLHRTKPADRHGVSPGVTGQCRELGR